MKPILPGGAVMVGMILVCFALVGSQGAGDDKIPAPTASDIARYEAAQSKSGRDADAHIRLALWCEAHGLTAERLKHLSLAVLYDPANTLARGLIGPGRVSGEMGPARRDRPPDPGRPCSSRGGPRIS